MLKLEEFKENFHSNPDMFFDAHGDGSNGDGSETIVIYKVVTGSYDTVKLYEGRRNDPITQEWLKPIKAHEAKIERSIIDCFEAHEDLEKYDDNKIYGVLSIKEVF